MAQICDQSEDIDGLVGRGGPFRLDPVVQLGHIGVRACPRLPRVLAVGVEDRVIRVGLDTSAWDGVPRSVLVNGLTIRINWFTGSDATISVTRGFQDHFLLLVVPPGTDPDSAASAMAGASVTGNHTPAAELLLG